MTTTWRRDARWVHVYVRGGVSNRGCATGFVIKSEKRSREPWKKIAMCRWCHVDGHFQRGYFFFSLPFFFIRWKKNFCPRCSIPVVGAFRCVSFPLSFFFFFQLNKQFVRLVWSSSSNSSNEKWIKVIKKKKKKDRRISFEILQRVIRWRVKISVDETIVSYFFPFSYIYIYIEIKMEMARRIDTCSRMRVAWFNCSFSIPRNAGTLRNDE